MFWLADNFGPPRDGFAPVSRESSGADGAVKILAAVVEGFDFGAAHAPLVDGFTVAVIEREGFVFAPDAAEFHDDGIPNHERIEREFPLTWARLLLGGPLGFQSSGEVGIEARFGRF